MPLCGCTNPPPHDRKDTPMGDTAEVQTIAPITITFDIAEVVKHLVPDYDAPFDEDGPPPMGALDGILKHVADRLVASIRTEYVKAAAERAATEVQAQVAAIAQQVLDEGGVVGDGYTRKQTKPLREMIRDEVVGWAGHRPGGYGSDPTNMQKYIKAEVDKAIKADLTAVLDEERQRFREAVRAIAAAQLADDAARRR